MSDIIQCEGVSKRFRLPEVEHHTLRGRVLHPLTRPTYREFTALRDVSFSVADGEFFGIIGRNGSGKSTLLKTIAGIYRADSGRVRVNGSLASFIELGVGFNQELSGYDNLLINGALLGLSRREVRARMDEIIEFAELDGFMDVKLRNFSSGMQVRLAFSIALQAEVDVLLTDEVLAVGDARFQEKCYEVFRERKAKGRTIVFVSHDMTAVQLFCDRAMLIDRGEVVNIGETHMIARNYLQLNKVDRTKSKGALVVAEDVDADDRPVASIVSAWLEDEAGDHTYARGHGEVIRFVVRIRALSRTDRAAVGIAVQDPLGQYIFMTNSELADASIGMLDDGEEVDVRFDMPNYLAHGSYSISCSISPLTSERVTGPITELRDPAWQFQSTAPPTTHGIVDLPVSASIRSAQDAP